MIVGDVVTESGFIVRGGVGGCRGVCGSWLIRGGVWVVIGGGGVDS